jgi:hypothetical protein
MAFYSENAQWRRMTTKSGGRKPAPKKYTLADLESVSGVTAEFFSTAMSRTFYEEYCDDLSGMSGVWQYVRDAALILEKESKAFGTAGEDFDWFQSVQDFACSLMPKRLDPSQMRKLAKQVLADNKYFDTEAV